MRKNRMALLFAIPTMNVSHRLGNLFRQIRNNTICGIKPKLVAGSHHNLKVTHAADLELAALILSAGRS